MCAREGTLRTRHVHGGRGPYGPRVVKAKEDGRRKHSVLSLFAGGGGLDLGLHLTRRYRHLACVEYDKAACRTLETNRDAGQLGDAGLIIKQADISKLDPMEMLDELGLVPGEVGLVVGGPPCQSFSSAGKQLGTADPRGRLIWDYVRWVKAVRPDGFVLENVCGLLSMPSTAGGPKGGLLAGLLKRFKRIGYAVEVLRMDAADYGTPQSRLRAVLVGNRHGLRFRPPVPTHGPGLIPHRTLRDAVAGLEEADPVLLDFSPSEKEVLRLVPPGGDYRDLPVRVAMRVLGPGCRPRGKGGCRGYRRLAWDRPSPTVLTGPNRGLASLCHPAETRALTARECARLQGWPDGWTFVGSKSDQYRQVGNGVAVPLAYRLGHAVADLLDDIGPDQRVAVTGQAQDGRVRRVRQAG